jgi:hypothetical protein
MKNSRLILKIFIATILLAFAIPAFAGRTQVDIQHYTEGEGRPTIRTAPVLCFADKEAGYVEVTFKRRFGDVRITITDTNGVVVAETSLDTNVENFATLQLPNSNDSYTIEIEGDRYSGIGHID